MIEVVEKSQSSWVRHGLAAAAALLLLLPSIICSWPGLRDAARLAFMLRGGKWEARREAIFGSYYARAATIRRAIPRDDIVAIVPRQPSDRDIAMFCVYALYPVSARVYPTMSAWRNNIDPESARRVPRPRWVVVVDQSSGDVLTLNSSSGESLTRAPR